MTICAVVAQALGPATWSLLPPLQAWQAAGGGRKGPGVGRPGRSGQYPCPVSAVQAAAGEVVQVQGGGAVLQPGVVLGGAEVAQLEPPPAAAGDLGDHPFHIRPVLLVVLAQGGLGGPGRAGSPQDRIAGMQAQGPPSFGGSA